MSSTPTVTGFVVPRIVRSPSTANSPFDFCVTFVLLNTISGWLSASRKSAERRCPSRFSSPVFTVLAGMRSSMPPASCFAGSKSMTPVAPPNPPRTVVSIMCFTAAVMVVWLGSICHCIGLSLLDGSACSVGRRCYPSCCAGTSCSDTLFRPRSPAPPAGHRGGAAGLGRVPARRHVFGGGTRGGARRDRRLLLRVRRPLECCDRPEGRAAADRAHRTRRDHEERPDPARGPARRARPPRAAPPREPSAPPAPRPDPPGPAPPPPPRPEC